MTDFVTRLEEELRQAAVRRENAGWTRAAFPRVRVALRDLPAVAVATLAVAVSISGAAIFLGSEPQRPADQHVPKDLRGAWQGRATGMHLYARGSQRCANLGLGSNACYTLDSAETGVAIEWGTLSITGSRITFRGEVPRAVSGVYRWRLEGGSLRLTKLRDLLTGRATALGAGPLREVRKPHAINRPPAGWTSKAFTSTRYGYSIRFPRDWTTDTSGHADRFSRDPTRGALPAVMIEAEDVPPDMIPGRWQVIVNSRVESGVGCINTASAGRRLTVDGVDIPPISVYRACNRRNEQWASFMHAGRGYRAAWWGRPEHQDADAPLFDALLKTLRFVP